MIFGIENIVLAVFFTGIITAFLPCTFPIILAFIGLLSTNSPKQNLRRFYISRTLIFFSAFAIVYAILGSIAGFFGQFSNTTLFITGDLRAIIIWIGGVFFILFGLLLLRVIPLPKAMRGIKTFTLPKWARTDSNISSFLLGAIFAFAWSPCISPVLGGVLLLATTSETVLNGAMLLLIFAFGIAVPFLILSYFYSSLLGFFKNKIEIITKTASIIGGLTFIFLGVLFLMDNIGYLTVISELSSIYSLLL